ncbi:MAG: 2-succinyl-5-enolpyruvyl-6-hydroxy-3-cyclohexene-1-carboxylic-acid synthase [Proteobacteria bacterium]|nr:2-succinyl-5-enolpyruvyl-6-hydroxy-3-cyclohexene-1-carboxylic-acid synthase [Pseudomonadota bacterium]
MSEQAAINVQAARRAADAIAANGGKIVLSPGGRSGTLALAVMDADSACTPKMVLDERAAAFLGLGWARASASPVALLCTSGSAGAHYLPALIEAWHSRIPLVAITADRPPELQDRGAPQTTRQTFFADFVAERIDPGPPTDAAGWADAVNQAFAAARSASRPVQLNLPMREPLWQAESTAFIAATPRNEQEAAPKPAHLPPAFLAVERGLIHCGNDAGIAPELPALVQALGETLGWPVLTEAASGARAKAADGAADIVAASGQLPPPQAVLRFGRAPLHRSTRAWLAQAEHTLCVDPHGDLHHPEENPATLLEGDTAATARAHISEGKSGWRDEWQDALEGAFSATDRAADEGWWEGRIAKMTASAAHLAGAALQVANSMPIRDLDIFGACQTRVRSSRGINGIDGTVATATGAAIVHPTWVLIGDLALLHDASSLSLARQLGVSGLRVIVVDNGGGGIFHQLPFAGAEQQHFERTFITPQHVDIAGIARARGLEVAVVEDPTALDTALAGPAELIHVRVDREVSVQTRRTARASAVAAIGEAA